jgi:hypothetical protein
VVCTDDGARTEQQGDHRTGRRQIGTEIGFRFDAQAEDAPVAVEGERGIAHLVTAMGAGKELVRARCPPFDRPAETPCGDGRHRIFGVKIRLETEPAADIRHQDAYLLRRRPQHAVGQLLAQSRGRLRDRAQGEALARRIVFGKCRARFERIRYQPVVDDPQADDMRCARKGRIRRRCVAEPSIGHDIAGRARPQLRRIGRGCGIHCDDRRQQFVFDGDALGRVLGLGLAFSQHRSDRVADEPHAAAGERETRRALARLAVGTIGARRRGYSTGPFRFEIGTGQNRDHARHGPRLRRID